MNDPRLAFLHPHFPFQVRSRLNRRRQEITLTIRLQPHSRQPGIAATVQRGLDALAGLGAMLDRHEQAGTRTLRVDAQLKAWEKRKAAVRAAYLKLRKLNVQHRAAVRAVSDSPAFADLREQWRWTRAEFSSCIGPRALYLTTIPNHPGASPKVVSLSERWPRRSRSRRTIVRVLKSDQSG